MKKALLLAAMILIILIYYSHSNHRNESIQSVAVSDEDVNSQSWMEMVENSKADLACQDTEELKNRWLTDENKDLLIAQKLEEIGYTDNEIYKIGYHHLNSGRVVSKYGSYIQARGKSLGDKADVFLGEEGELLFDLVIKKIEQGKTEQLVADFKNNNLMGFDFADSEHKIFLANIISSKDATKTKYAIDEIYSDQISLPDDILIIAAKSRDSNFFENIISRIGDINNAKKMSLYGVKYGVPTGMYHLIVDKKFGYAELLLERGIRPRPQNEDRNILDTIFMYKADKIPLGLVKKLLNNGYQSSSSDHSIEYAKKIAKRDFALADHFRDIAGVQKAEEKMLLENLPFAIQEEIKENYLFSKNIQDNYAACQDLITAKKLARRYTNIDLKKVEAIVEQALEEKITQEQAIQELALIDKDAVEYGYWAFRKNKTKAVIGENNLAKQKKLFELLRKENWQQLTQEVSQLDYNNEIVNKLLARVIMEDIPQDVIAVLMSRANKKSNDLFYKVRRDELLVEKLIANGFDVHNVDAENKNIFYNLVVAGDIKNLDTFMEYDVDMVTDSYGYDPLDGLLRSKSLNLGMLKKLKELDFPVTDEHEDYALYLKTYYPEKYQQLISVMPELTVIGK